MGSGNGLHYVGPDSTLKQNRYETREHRGNRHQLGAEPLYGSLNCCGLDVCVSKPDG